jgi:hypothetical protein
MGSYFGSAVFIALNICKSQSEVQLHEAATKPCKARMKRLDSSFLSSTNRGVHAPIHTRAIACRDYPLPPQDVSDGRTEIC